MGGNIHLTRAAAGRDHGVGGCDMVPSVLGAAYLADVPRRIAHGVGRAHSLGKYIFAFVIFVIVGIGLLKVGRLEHVRRVTRPLLKECFAHTGTLASCLTWCLLAALVLVVVRHAEGALAVGRSVRSDGLLRVEGVKGFDFCPRLDCARLSPLLMVVL